MKTIKLTKSQISGVKEATKLTEYKFYNNVQRFLSDLLKDPVGVNVPFLLKTNGIDKNKLLYHLKSNGIINRYSRISDKDSQGNPKTATMLVKYSVPKKDFVKKMKRLFIDLVAKNIPDNDTDDKDGNEIEECDCGGVSAGATNCQSSGSFVGPMLGTQRRQLPTDIKETTATTNVGDYQYTVPFPIDSETADRTPGFSAERKDENIEEN